MNFFFCQVRVVLQLPSLSIYLASNFEIVTLFMEQFSGLISETSDDFSCTMLIRYAGCFGGRSWIVSLESIVATSSMVGLSAARSCMHKRPTWMHLSISDEGNDSSIIVGSISSKPFPSFHNCHAWYKTSCTQC